MAVGRFGSRSPERSDSTLFTPAFPCLALACPDVTLPSCRFRNRPADRKIIIISRLTNRQSRVELAWIAIAIALRLPARVHGTSALSRGASKQTTTTKKTPARRAHNPLMP